MIGKTLGERSFVVRERPADPVTKRLFDLALASSGFLFFLPVWMLISVAIYFEDGRPILFIQQRVGRGGREFTAYKFRTIYRRFDDQMKKGVAVHSDDKRVMKVGRILRKTALNELPQLLNILRGDMSFVGPRPEPPEFIAAYEKEVPNLRQIRYQIRPGLTGIAQVFGPHNMSALYAKAELLVGYQVDWDVGMEYDLCQMGCVRERIAESWELRADRGVGSEATREWN